MIKEIQSRSGRDLLMAIIVVCAASAFIILFMISRDGAVGTANFRGAALKLAGYYGPLFTLMAGFFFKDKLGASTGVTEIEAFLFAIGVVFVYALIPILVLSYEQYIEDIVDDLTNYQPVLQSGATLALGYYFAKSS